MIVIIIIIITEIIAYHCDDDDDVQVTGVEERLLLLWQKGVNSGNSSSKQSSAPSSLRYLVNTLQYMAVSGVSFSKGTNLSVSKYWNCSTSSLGAVSLKRTLRAPAGAEGLAPALAATS